MILPITREPGVRRATRSVPGPARFVGGGLLIHCMQNIEFKAELRDLEAARRQCDAIGAQFIGTLRQTDTYYKLTDGRLKRRTAPGEPVEWIFYHRPDHVSPRLSNYSILDDEQAARRWGIAMLREWLRVEKTRELWMTDHVRIHLDCVEKLGTFLEFEGLISQSNPARAAIVAVNKLRRAFEPVLGEPVAASYADLMAQELSGERQESDS